MQSIAPHRNNNSRRKTDLADAAPELRAARPSHLPRRNFHLAILLACIAVLGFAIVILFSVLLRYGETHHLVAGI